MYRPVVLLSVYHCQVYLLMQFIFFTFLQSGKLVMKMFARIQELIDDPNALVFVLIDEV